MDPAAFWDEQRQLLFEIVYPDVLQAIEDGLVEAADMLSAEVGLDWGLLNAWAADYAKTYTYELVHDITDSTMAVLREKVNSWVASGVPLDDMIKELAATGLYDDYRAFMIATTEITRAFGEGNIEAWKQSGIVKQVQWMTANDEVVCDICGVLDGNIIDLGDAGFEGYSSDPEELNMVECPPAHVNCRCWLRPIWG